MNEYFGLVLADLHAFHACGLTPKNFRASTGAIVPLNIAQEYLLECWNHMLSVLPQKIDFLLLNGDLAEGQNPAERARSLSEVDPTFQARGVVALLGPVIDRVRKRDDGSRLIYIMRGSGYHTGRGGLIEEQIGAMIGSIPDSYGRYTHPWARFTVSGVYFDCAHRQSTTIRNRTTPLEREIGFALERFARKRQPAPDSMVIIRSHTHSGFRMVSERGIVAVSTPCWKIQDDYAATSISPNRLAPDNIGAVGIRVRPSSYRERVEVIEYLYDHPDDSVEVLL